MGSRRGLTKDTGATGLKESWGVIQDDFLREWNGAEKRKRIDEMVRNSAVVGALRYTIEQMLREMTWTVASAEEDDPRLDLIQESIDNMSHSVNDHIVDVAMTPFDGFTLFSVTYEQVGGRLLWRKFKQLGPNTIQRWLLADDGGLVGVQQLPYLWPEPIPIERCLLYRFRKPLGNPEGESILRPAWTSWYYVKNIQQVEAIGIERNLAGMPVITPPQGATTDEDVDKAELIVRNVRNDEQAGVVLPAPVGEGDHNRWHFELLGSGGSTGKATDTDMVISRYDKRILMTALAQFLMIGQDNVGALATFEGGTDLFARSINALADNIGATFTQYAIPRLLEYNGIGDSSGIRLEHTPADDLSLELVGQFLQQTGAFVTWTPEDEAWLRDLSRMPAKDPEELEMLQEEERERKAEAARVFAQRTQPEVDENAALYVADRHPEDEELQRSEGRYTRAMRRILAGQKKGVTEDLG